MVGKYQCPYGVGLAVQLHHPGGRADAALEAVAAHSPPGTYSALGKIRPAVRQCGKHMVLGDMQPPDVVEVAVVALADHRVHTAGGLADIRIPCQHILHQRRLGGAHTEGVGKKDRGLQRAQLFDLHQSGGLAVAVDDMACRHHFFVVDVPRVRQQRRHTGLDRSICQRTVPHRHPRHIADLVQRALGQCPHPKAPFISFDPHSCSSLYFPGSDLYRRLPAAHRLPVS